MFDFKRFRKDKKLKQYDVADATGLDRARISKYETGTDPSEYVENLLLKAYPDLSEYKIEDQANEPPPHYESKVKANYLLTNFNTSEYNMHRLDMGLGLQMKIF